MRPYVFEFDIESNALDYLARAIGFLREVEAGDAHAWKWAVIGLHGALYGFAVSAAKGTDAYGNVTHVTKMGIRKLDSLDTVLQTCETPSRMKMNVGAKHLDLTAEQREAIRMLKDTLRNPFEHFTTATQFSGQGLPKIAHRVMQVIRFLALETNMFVHLNGPQRAEVEALIAEGFDICERVRIRYLTDNPAD